MFYLFVGIVLADSCSGRKLLPVVNPVKSIRFLTCTFRSSCYSTRLSWAHTPVINWVVCLGQKVSS